MPKNINDVLLEQNASDMFFNDERVVSAYKICLSEQNPYGIGNPDVNEDIKILAKELEKDFGEENSMIIAKDFLERV